MSRAIVGTRGIREQSIVKQPEGGSGRIRCPKCQNICSAAIDNATGRNVLRCGGCGVQFTSAPL